MTNKSSSRSQLSRRRQQRWVLANEGERRRLEAERRRPTDKQLIALWNMRIRELCNTLGRLYGLQAKIALRTGLCPELPKFPDTAVIREAESGNWAPEPELKVRAA